MSKNIYLLSFLFFWLPVNHSFAQALTSSQIDSLVQVASNNSTMAGIAIAVVENDQVVHMKGYGTAVQETGLKVDENTLFAIASNTKAFTTAALAILVDEGKLKWTDKVIDYIPEFKMYAPYVTENFNIQDLLTHRSGLGLGAGDLMFFPDGGNFTVDDVVKSFQHLKPQSAFRTKYDYDNLLYIVAGEVVARISGLSWADFVETRIMEPLGMARSKAVYQRLDNLDNVAQPHTASGNDLTQIPTYTKNDESLGAAGGIYASVNDLSKWLIMHLNRGAHNNKKLIERNSHEELWKPHTNQNFNLIADNIYNTHFEAYGLGWQLQDKAGYITVEHTGSLPGMRSRTIMIPELKVGIVVLTNTSPGAEVSWSVANEIMDSYLGIESQNWVTKRIENYKENEFNADTFTEQVWEDVKTKKDTDVKYSDYEGTYNDPWFGNFVIEEKDNQLWIKADRSPKLTGKMYYYKANTFAIEWQNPDEEYSAFASFNLDENGKAIEIKMKGISPLIDFSYDFHDLDLTRVE